MNVKKRENQVHFIGAGPGDPELITVKGQKCIQNADLVLYTGSLVPKEVVVCTKEDAVVVDSSSMTLDETHAMILKTAKSGGMVARVHTGDPSLYGAIKEQMVLLDQDGVSYEVIPGVTAAFAAAAAARVSFTLPEKTQSLIFTRLGGRTPMPEKESLKELARSHSSMAIYLSSTNPETVEKALMEGGYPEDTPVVIGYRIGQPDQRLITTSISLLARDVKQAGINKQAVFLILPGQQDDPIFSRLYSRDFSHGFRQ
ncbi:MAG: precorrin-4 C(11)-methyltransferase [Thermodesulfobacteriota bacterium]|nr:precorrin-4 C(11)-methyltransferase [Thermodesulfobacteriota bacterium]